MKYTTHISLRRIRIHWSGALQGAAHGAAAPLPQRCPTAPWSVPLRTVTAAAILLAAGLAAHAQSTATPAPVAPQTAPAVSQNAMPPQMPAIAATNDAVEEDILDIRGPIHIPAARLWWAWIGGALALAAAGYGAWLLARRGLRAKLPYELALARLEAARRLMQPEHAREFSFLVSEVVRGWIEERFGLRAAHRTTNEFLHELVRDARSPLAQHTDGLCDFLNHCDLAKFARWALSVPQMEAMLQSAATFITETGKPTEAPKTKPTAPVPIVEPVATAN